MNSVKVKICGLTNVNDVLDAIEFGADYLGFNFYPDSPRYVTPTQAKQIFDEIPGNIPRVGVFVNEDLKNVVDLAIALKLDLLQFHGDESAAQLNTLGRPWFKSFRLRNEKDLIGIDDYQCDWILVDAYSETAYGGTGVIAHWDLVHGVEKFGKKLILAGGLKEENIALAVATVKPFMVDVASGVEVKPGIKDRRLMELFIKKAKAN